MHKLYKAVCQLVSSFIYLDIYVCNYYNLRLGVLAQNDKREMTNNELGNGKPPCGF